MFTFYYMKNWNEDAVLFLPESKDVNNKENNNEDCRIIPKDIVDLISWKIDWIVFETNEKDEDYKNLIEKLNSNVIWQNKAKEELVMTILEELLVIPYNKWPVGVLFFSWPTWVWKTQIVKALAKAIFWEEDSYIHINWESLTDSISKNSLFWAPPAYVGYNDDMVLTNENLGKNYKNAKKSNTLNSVVRRIDWFNIVLFDEIEKAHPVVIQSLLGLLDSWKWQLANSEELDFTKTLVIFTSNIWESEIRKNTEKNYIWFTQSDDYSDTDRKEIIKREMWNKFSPEFIWRINKVIKFEDLKDEDYRWIIDIKVNNVNEQLEEINYISNIKVELTDTVYDYLISCIDKSKGARSLDSIFKREIWIKLWTIVNKWKLDKYILLENTKFKLLCDYNDVEDTVEIKIVLWEEISSIVEEDDNFEKLENGTLKIKWMVWVLSKINKDVDTYIHLYSTYLKSPVDISEHLLDYEIRLEELWFSEEDFFILRTKAYADFLKTLDYIVAYDGLILESKVINRVILDSDTQIRLRDIIKVIKHSIKEYNEWYIKYSNSSIYEHVTFKTFKFVYRELEFDLMRSENEKELLEKELLALVHKVIYS